MRSVAASLTSAAGHSDVARELAAPLQRQAELFQQVLGHAFAPLDATFGLLEQSASAMREQAEAVEHAAEALLQASGLMKAQADLFERAVRTLREPSKLMERAVGLDPES